MILYGEILLAIDHQKWPIQHFGDQFDTGANAVQNVSFGITLVWFQPWIKFQPSLFQGRLYLYLSQREFISCDGHVDDIKGVAYVPDSSDVLKGEVGL